MQSLEESNTAVNALFASISIGIVLQFLLLLKPHEDLIRATTQIIKMKLDISKILREIEKLRNATEAKAREAKESV